MCYDKCEYVYGDCEGPGSGVLPANPLPYPNSGPCSPLVGPLVLRGTSLKVLS